MYQGVINKRNVILGKERTEKDEFLVDIFLDGDNVKINFLDNSFSDNEYINRSFSKIEIDLKENKILNLKNMISKWKTNKKELLFETKDFGFISTIMMISDYFVEENSLEFLILNYSIIPYIILGLKKEKSEFRIYREFYAKNLDFTVELKKDEDDDYIIEGKISNLFDMTGYKRMLREILKIEPSKNFNLNFKLKGKTIYKDEILKEMDIKIELEENDYNYGEIEFQLKEVI